MMFFAEFLRISLCSICWVGILIGIVPFAVFAIYEFLLFLLLDIFNEHL